MHSIILKCSFILLLSLDSIFQKKCRQRIAMDSEISELRKTCKPRTTSLVRTTNSHRIRSGQAIRDSSCTERLTSITVQDARLRSMKSKQTFADNPLSGKNYHISVHGPSLQPAKDFSPKSACELEAEIKASGQDGTCARKTLHGTQCNNSVCNDSCSDDSEDSISSTEDGRKANDNSSSKEETIVPFPLTCPSKFQSKDKRETYQNSLKDKWKWGDKIDHTVRSNNKCQEKSRKLNTSRGEKTELNINLAILKLDAVPFQWYTTVVQPRDSSMGRRPRTAKLSGFPQTSRQLNISGKRSSKQASSQFNYAYNDRHTSGGYDNCLQRPQTSVGIVTTKHRSFQSSFDDHQNNKDTITKWTTSSSGHSFTQENSSKRYISGKRKALTPQPTGGVSFFERSRPRTSGKSRRQLVEQAQFEASGSDSHNTKPESERRKRKEDIAAQQVSLNLKVKDFLCELETFKKPHEKKDILGRLVRGMTLEKSTF